MSEIEIETCEYEEGEEISSQIPPNHDASETSRYTECRVRGALAISLHISRVFGCAPLLFYKEVDGWRIQFSPRLCIFSYFIHCVFSIFIIRKIVIRQMINMSEMVDFRNIIINIFLGGRVAITSVASTAAVCILRGRTENIIHSMHRLEKIKIQQNSSQSTEVSSRERRRDMLSLAFNCGAYIFLVFCTNINLYIQVLEFRRTYIYDVWIFIDGFRVILVITQLMLTIEIINSKLLAVNIILKNIINDMKLQNVQSNQVPVHEAVHRVCLNFETICDVQRDVDQVNGALILLLILKQSLHLVEAPHQFIDMFTGEHKNTYSLSSILIQLMWCVSHFTVLLSIIEPCHHIVGQVGTTRDLVLRLMCETTSYNDPLSTELEYFYKQIDLNTPCYTAMEVCTVTRGLTATIIGSIITYLVVIVQFE